MTVSTAFIESAADPVSMAANCPQVRFMGSKRRLLGMIHDVTSGLDFSTVLDAFSGSGAVSYLFKCMGKEVTSNDFLRFTSELATATVANADERVTEDALACLMAQNRRRKRFIERTFSGIFYTPEDLRFLDTVWSNLDTLETPVLRSMAMAALIRSCIKRQPRATYQVSDPKRYDDGRRDLHISLREHFAESVAVYNEAVFDNGRENKAICGDVFDVPDREFDLVYMDPPYVPRSDDNCYIKRYHFLEGLASYWLDPKAKIMFDTKTRKIPKRQTPFSHQRTAIAAFDAMFQKFSSSILVLSYSSNAWPDLDVVVKVMKKHKREVVVERQSHRYSFGTHKGVAKDRAVTEEYLVIGTD